MCHSAMDPCVEHLETAGGPLSSAAVTNAHHRFVYNGYLCVQRLDAANDNDVNLLVVWDPTEPVATRPLFMLNPGGHAFFCTHDGNKNVSEVFFFQQAYGIAAHYEYAPFGAVTAATRNTSVTSIDARTFNPFRFSSEYADDTLGLVYYNYRHYNPVDGRWLSQDALNELGGLNIYAYLANSPYDATDLLGLLAPPPALIKCAKSIITQQIKKFIKNYLTLALLCKKAGESFYLPDSGMTPCQAGDLAYTGEGSDKPPAYDVASFKDSVLSCFVKTLKGKALDKLLKGISDEDLKKFVKSLTTAGEKGIRNYLASTPKDNPGTYRLQYNCNDKKLEVQVFFDTTLFTPDGNINLSVPVSERFSCIGGKFPQWQNGISDMCNCCDEPKQE